MPKRRNEHAHWKNGKSLTFLRCIGYMYVRVESIALRLPKFSKFSIMNSNNNCYFPPQALVYFSFSYTIQMFLSLQVTLLFPCFESGSRRFGGQVYGISIPEVKETELRRGKELTILVFTSDKFCHRYIICLPSQQPAERWIIFSNKSHSIRRRNVKGQKYNAITRNYCKCTVLVRFFG